MMLMFKNLLSDLMQHYGFNSLKDIIKNYFITIMYSIINMEINVNISIYCQATVYIRKQCLFKNDEALTIARRRHFPD